MSRDMVGDLISRIPEWVGGNVNSVDALFLSDLISKARPKRIVEIGTASGWSAAIMLLSGNASHEDFEGLSSYDLSERFFLDKSKKTGQIVYEMIPDLADKFHSHMGMISAQVELPIDSIEFAFIDAHHMHPWASLDLLAILPFLKRNTWIALHDIFLCTFERHKHKNRGPHYLYSQFHGLKICSENSPPTIGAIFLDLDKDRFAKQILETLYTPWEVKLSKSELEYFKLQIENYYSRDFFNEFCLMLERVANK